MIRFPSRGAEGEPPDFRVKMKESATTHLVLCIRNDGCDDLGIRNVYQVIEDPDAASEGYIRIVDESGEDYLYPEKFFVAIELPKDAAQVGAHSAKTDPQARGDLLVAQPATHKAHDFLLA